MTNLSSRRFGRRRPILRDWVGTLTPWNSFPISAFWPGYQEPRRRPFIYLRGLPSLVSFISSCLLIPGLLFGPQLSDLHAQVPTAITSDGTVGTVVTPNGHLHDITGGTRPGEGSNLLHSFGQFTVGGGDTANFLNDTGLPTNNILSRVTGGDASQIYGTIQTTDFGNANLFLMNPAGIVFGPNAALNVAGSVSVTTADLLRFENGAAFYADVSLDGTADSVLRTAPPAAFGFLGDPVTYGFTSDHPAPITFDQSQLQVAPGQTFSAVGGDIQVTGDADLSADTPTLKAPSGRINLISVASSGEVVGPTDTPANLQVGSFETLGNIELTTGARIDVGGDPGGTVYIRSGQLLLDNGIITAETQGDHDHPGVGMDIEVRGEMRLTGSALNETVLNASIESKTSGKGKAGDIHITADNLELQGVPFENVDGANITSRSTEESTGDTGNVTVTANSIVLRDRAFISTETFGAGKGGDVTVQTGSLKIVGKDGPQLAVVTSKGTGDAGTVTIDADSIFARGEDGPGRFFAGIDSRTVQGSGRGGDVVVRTGSLHLLDGARITANTQFSSNDGGNIDIKAKDLFVQGVGQIGNSLFPSGIFANADGATGNSGSIGIKSQKVEIRDGGAIDVANFGSAGDAGTVDIETDTLLIEGVHTEFIDGVGEFNIRPGIFANSQPRSDPVSGNPLFPTGNGGTIGIKSRSLQIRDGGRIEASSVASAGGPSNINIEADNLLIEGVHQTEFGPIASGIVANTIFGPRKGGNIQIKSQNVEILSGATIESSTEGPAGDAGNINIEADDLSVSGIVETNRPSGIFADTFPFRDPQTGQVVQVGTGNGGNIQIKSQNLEVTNSSSISTRTFPDTSGNAGNINLMSQTLAVTNGASILSENFGEGRGGTIGVRANSITLQDGLISTLAGPFAQDAGAITMRTSSLDVSDGAIIRTETFGGGSAGTIDIMADRLAIGGRRFLESEAFVDSEISAASKIFSDQGGPGGNVRIKAGTIELFDHGFISATSETSGKGGNIEITADSLTLRGGAEITAKSSSTGDAGNVDLMVAGTVQINNSSVTTSADEAKGGDVTITAKDNIFLGNDALVSTRTLGGGDAGKVALTGGGTIQLDNSTVSTSAQVGEGGDITITAGQHVELMNGSTVLAESSGAGNSGAVTIEAAGGNFQSDNSTVSTSAQQAQGGDINITAMENVDLDNSTISAQSSGPGNAGDITVTAGNDVQMLDSTISTEAAEASGGNIKLTAPNFIILTNSKIASSVLGGRETQGGNINLDPIFIILENSQILANAFAGNGGNITLTASGGIFLDPQSRIDASSQLGIDGVIFFNAPIVALAEVVTALPKNFAIPQSLFAEACAARTGGQYSSFTQGPPGSLPPAPGGFLSSPLMLNNPSNISSPRGMSQGSPLSQLRLGLDVTSSFPAIMLLPEKGCIS